MDLFTTKKEVDQYPERHLESNELLGALFTYLLFFGQRRFKTIYHNRNEKRNILLGFLIKLTVLIAATYWVVIINL
jgi:hypothetical protein